MKSIRIRRVKLQNAPLAADGTGLAIRYGVVQSIQPNYRGSGYNSRPNVRITGGGGSEQEHTPYTQLGVAE